MNMEWIEQFSVKDRVAVITGAAGGLGCELAKILGAAGARIFIADIDEPRLGELSQTIDPTGEAVLVQKCQPTHRE